MKFFILVLLLLKLNTSFAYIPSMAKNFKFNIKTSFFTVENEVKLSFTLNLFKKIIASEKFKSKVLEYHFMGVNSFHMNKGLTNLQIYYIFLRGAETLRPYKNNTLDTHLEIYTDLESNVLAYTRPSSLKIWLNSKYFDKHTPAEIAGNLAHEWLHKLGFDHEAEFTESREHSIPYAIGYIVRDIGKEMEMGLVDEINASEF